MQLPLWLEQGQSTHEADPTEALPRTRPCTHGWEPLGVEVVICRKCSRAIVEVDGMRFEDTWPLRAAAD